MNTTIYAYNNTAELAGILQGITGENLRFVIPSRKDKFFFPLKDSYRELWTWEDIYRNITRQNRQPRRMMLSPPDHLLILRTILDEVLAKFPEKADLLPGMKRTGFLELVSGDIRELMNEAVSTEQLPMNPESDNPSEFLLPEVYSRYVSYLDGYKLLDSAGVYTAAFESLQTNPDWGRDLVIVFTGFLSFTHGQLELVKALQARCRQVIIIKPEANLADFRDVAVQLGQHKHAELSSGRIAELDVSEPDLEPEVIARTLALWSAGEKTDWGEFPGFDGVGLMLADGREEAFAQAFERYGVPCSFMSGIPISRTLPGRVLSSLRDLEARQFPPHDTAMFLTHPCFAGTAFPVMSAYRAGRSGLNDWAEYLAGSDEEIFADALKAVQAVKKFCDVLSRQNTPVKIMGAFRDFLKTPGLWLDKMVKDMDLPEDEDLPELDESLRQTASAIETVEHKALALEELQPDLGSVKDAKFDRDKAYNFLESWCRNTNTRAPVQTANAVRIFTGQPPVLASFPVWIMTGITQKTWSSNIIASPVLGTKDREQLKTREVYLPLPVDKTRQREALFRRLLHTGERLTVLLRPLLDDEGRPVPESPFMQNFKDDAKDNWAITKDNTANMNILLGGDGYIFPEIDAADTLERSVPLIKKKAHSVGAADINELLFCPFLWWQKRQAKIYEAESELASAIDWGNLLHRYWECVWRSYSVDMTADGRTFRRIAAEEWSRLIDPQEGGSYESFRRILHDSRLKRRLNIIAFRAKRLANVQADILDGLHSAGWVHRKILLEEDAHLMAQVNGVTFLGQCDRIEILRNPDGAETAFIADYKTGKGERNEKDAKIDSFWWNTENRAKFTKGLQLSVYAALFKRCDLSGVYILGLESGKVSGTVAPSAEEIFTPYAMSTSNDKSMLNTDILTRINEGAYAMECAARILERGEFLPEYTSDLCRWCSVKSLCRRGEFREEISADDE